MYLAEIHGKLSRNNENKEDILTSNVFSFFKYANRELFLYQLIKSLGLNVTAKDAMLAEFHFWPSFQDHTEPDLIILIGPYYLLFEAKYHSGFGKETPILKNQLAREVDGGVLEAQNLDKEFKIIAITADHYFKREIRDAVPPHHRKDLIWMNWQTIAYLIDDLLEHSPNISIETQLLAEDLYKLLLKKGLRNYEGVPVLSKIPSLKTNPDNIFFQAKTAAYRGDFIGFIQALDISEKLIQHTSYIFFISGRAFYESLPRVDFPSLENGALFFERNRKDE